MKWISQKWSINKTYTNFMSIVIVVALLFEDYHRILHKRSDVTFHRKKKAIVNSFTKILKHKVNHDPSFKSENGVYAS